MFQHRLCVLHIRRRNGLISLSDIEFMESISFTDADDTSGLYPSKRAWEQRTRVDQVKHGGQDEVSENWWLEADDFSTPQNSSESGSDDGVPTTPQQTPELFHTPESLREKQGYAPTPYPDALITSLSSSTVDSPSPSPSPNQPNNDEINTTKPARQNTPAGMYRIRHHSPFAPRPISSAFHTIGSPVLLLSNPDPTQPQTPELSDDDDDDEADGEALHETIRDSPTNRSRVRLIDDVDVRPVGVGVADMQRLADLLAKAAMSGTAASRSQRQSVVKPDDEALNGEPNPFMMPRDELTRRFAEQRERRRHQDVEERSQRGEEEEITGEGSVSSNILSNEWWSCWAGNVGGLDRKVWDTTKETVDE